ncbi:TIGR02444 family protein [Legionella cardiaca]|uniref:TIGR02444 family protein n=1 Tax=Legionella cardiaca TaxID=1071983 RepID=A0ABY8ATT1_9GAMM|nr:TIGR02444 family protein [Legionella cardiaca]WED42547.1 TIGR02444 family protein [Legionella cardiaca]
MKENYLPHETTADPLDNPLWQFSLTVYQHQEIKEQCLSLQNTTGVNVNLLLFCCWLSYGVELISHFEFIKACDTIKDWNSQVTKTLRQARQSAKQWQESSSWVKNFYQQILTQEINSEAYQQYRLYSYFAQKQTSSPKKDEILSLKYLYWLFDEMKLTVDEHLDKQLKKFIVTILQVV